MFACVCPQSGAFGGLYEAVAPIFDFSARLIWSEATMPLTDIEIRKSNQRDKEWKLTDSGGLYLLIRPNGSKLWRLKYRVDGKEQKLSFGSYPVVSLKEARILRDQARADIGRGGDPARPTGSSTCFAATLASVRLPRSPRTRF